MEMFFKDLFQDGVNSCEDDHQQQLDESSSNGIGPWTTQALPSPAHLLAMNDSQEQDDHPNMCESEAYEPFEMDPQMTLMDRLLSELSSTDVDDMIDSINRTSSGSDNQYDDSTTTNTISV